MVANELIFTLGPKQNTGNPFIKNLNFAFSGNPIVDDLLY